MTTRLTKICDALVDFLIKRTSSDFTSVEIAVLRCLRDIIDGVIQTEE